MKSKIIWIFSIYLRD